MKVNPDGLRAFVAELRDDFPVTLPAAVVRELLAAFEGGPRVLSTRGAATSYGWKSRDWARWAAEGMIPGAVRNGKGWDLPRDACESLYAKRMGSGGAVQQEPRRTVTPRLSDRRGNHGPRGSKGTKQAEGEGSATIPIAPRLHRR